jgi:glycosyltransferase involved in cell wall biosynthesis
VKFLVITLAPTLKKEDLYYSYAPYVREMDLWFSKVSEVTIVSPSRYSKELLTSSFLRKDIRLRSISELNFNSIKSIPASLFSIPLTVVKMIQEMKKADHIHLRCPGNIGLLGAIIQIFFPKKSKTAKYAGNWDPKAKQPVSYQFQKWLLSNAFLTKNMQVLVYGEWPKQTKNIKSFFTATYYKNQIENNLKHEFTQPYRFIFVGSLSPGKRPLYAIKLMKGLIEKKIAVRLDLYGEGVERSSMENYIAEFNLTESVSLHGNQTAETLEAAYKIADFLLLPSKSEGWPKAVAEAMLWGAVPVVTNISCVPWMLDQGKRGVLIEAVQEEDVAILLPLLGNAEKLQKLSVKAQKWSQNYTLDIFEAEIAKLINT